MRTALRRFPLVIFASSFLATQTAGAADFYWTNTASLGSWNVATNWSPNQVPGGSDVAFITNPVSYVVLSNTASVGRLSLGSQATLELKSHLTLNGASTNRGRLYLTGLGILSGSVLCVEAGGLLDTFSGLSIGSPLVIAMNGSLYKYENTFMETALTNSGVVVWFGTPSASFGTGIIVNEQSGVFFCGGDVRKAVINRGTWIKDSPDNTYVSGSFVNTGIVDIQYGKLFFNDFTQTAGVTLLKGGNLMAIQYSDTDAYKPLKIFGGCIRGTGIIDGPVMTMSGQFSPGFSSGGSIEMRYWCYETAAAAFNVEIGGMAAGVDFDQLRPGELSMNLDGAINICLINGFVPAPGDRFEIVKVLNSFQPPNLSCSAKFTGLDVANGLRLEPVITRTNIVLVATNAPLSSSPSMNLFRDGDDLWLCWPRGYETFQLQSASSPDFANWTPITATESNRYILRPTSARQFFRMAGP